MLHAEEVIAVMVNLKFKQEKALALVLFSSGQL